LQGFHKVYLPIGVLMPRLCESRDCIQGP